MAARVRSAAETWTVIPSRMPGACHGGYEKGTL